MDPEPTVRVIHAQRGPIKLSIILPGDLVGFYEAALHAKVTGYLKSVLVDKGDKVKTGDLLALVEVPELHSNLAHAQATLAINKITYERQKRVQESDPRIISQETVDIAYSKYQESVAAVRTLKTMVDYTRIVAPFSGVITGRFADPGALVRAGGGDIGVNESSALISPGATEGAGGHRSGGGPIFTLAKVDKLRVYVYVPERWVHFIRRGTPATLTFDGIPNLKIRSSIVRIAGALDLTTRTMLAEIDIDNPKGVLYPRMYSHVELDLVTHSNALLLPTTAVDGQGATASVFLVRDGRLEKASVRTGLFNPGKVEITAGLTPDDSVVEDYTSELVQGEKVRQQLIEETLTSKR